MSMENKEKIKLTREEIETVVNLQQQTQTIINILGNIELSKINLEKQHKQVLDDLDELNEKQNSWNSDISSKYGDGSIDMNSWEFTPKISSEK